MSTAIVPYQVQPPAAMLPTVPELDMIKAIAHTAGGAKNLLPTIGSGNNARAMTEGEATVIMVYGRELGVQPLAALQQIYIVKGRPETSTQLKVGLMQSFDPNSGVEILERTLERAKVRITYKGRKGVFVATKEDAARANLLGNPTWKSYPMQMLVWTATRTGVRIMAPDALLRLAPLPSVAEVEPLLQLKGVDGVDLDGLEAEAPSLSDEHETVIVPDEAEQAEADNVVDGTAVDVTEAAPEAEAQADEQPAAEAEPPVELEPLNDEETDQARFRLQQELVKKLKGLRAAADWLAEREPKGVTGSKGSYVLALERLDGLRCVALTDEIMDS